MEEKEKFNQTAYINEFRRKNYKRIDLQIPLRETEILEKLKTVENRTSYILDLIRKDIQSNK